MLFNKVVDNQALRPNWINTLLLTNDVTEKIRILKSLYIYHMVRL